MKSSPHINRARRLIVALLAVWNLGMLACSAAENDFASPLAGGPEPGWFGQTRGEVYQDLSLQEAERQLSTHNIADARGTYERIMSGQVGAGPGVEVTASVGRAVTSLMLLPGSNAARQIVSMHLGATNTSYDIERLMWAENGILFWLSSGVRWEDDGELAGVKSLVRQDLPWSLERLGALTAFVDGLDRPADLAMSDLLALADDLLLIEQDLEVAERSPDFDYFLIPSGAFHHENLTLTLRKSEVQALRGTLALVRGAIYAVAAYQHRWTLQGAFGASWAEVAANPDDPAHIPGYTLDDYAWVYLDPALGRAFHDSARLEGARGALRDGLRAWSQAMLTGLEEVGGRNGVLDWSSADRESVTQASQVLSALAGALDGPTAIPHTAPATELDLSAFFDPGRTLADGTPWFSRGEEAWGLSDEAVQAFFLDGVMTPTPNLLGGDALPTVLGGEDALYGLLEGIFEGTKQRFEDAYFSTF